MELTPEDRLNRIGECIAAAEREVEPWTFYNQTINLLSALHLLEPLILEDGHQDSEELLGIHDELLSALTLRVEDPWSFPSPDGLTGTILESLILLRGAPVFEAGRGDFPPDNEALDRLLTFGWSATFISEAGFQGLGISSLELARRLKAAADLGSARFFSEQYTDEEMALPEDERQSAKARRHRDLDAQIASLLNNHPQLDDAMRDVERRVQDSSTDELLDLLRDNTPNWYLSAGLWSLAAGDFANAAQLLTNVTEDVGPHAEAPSWDIVSSFWETNASVANGDRPRKTLARFLPRFVDRTTPGLVRVVFDDSNYKSEHEWSFLTSGLEVETGVADPFIPVVFDSRRASSQQTYTLSDIQAMFEENRRVQEHIRTDIGALRADLRTALGREAFFLDQIAQLMPRKRRQQAEDALKEAVSTFSSLPRSARDRLVGAQYLMAEPELSSWEALTAIVASLAACVEVIGRHVLSSERVRFNTMPESLERRGASAELLDTLTWFREKRNPAVHADGDLTSADVQEIWRRLLGTKKSPGLIDEMMKLKS